MSEKIEVKPLPFRVVRKPVGDCCFCGSGEDLFLIMPKQGMVFPVCSRCLKTISDILEGS
jgi:hypothetical protein